MDKLEVSEQMAKAIVEYLLDHQVINKKWIHYETEKLEVVIDRYTSKEMLETYIREAILDFEAEQSFQQSIKDHDKVYERITGEKVNGKDRV